MPTTRLKWYSPFVLLVGATLSLADFVTDILTLVQFYRADHKIWFYVGLIFVLMQSFLVPLILRLMFGLEPLLCPLCVINPCSSFFTRFRLLLYCLKRRWNHSQVVPNEDGVEDADDPLRMIDSADSAVLFESLCESAPQFILQRSRGTGGGYTDHFITCLFRKSSLGFHKHWWDGLWWNC